MADMNKRGPDCDDCEGERGEHGERGERGRRGHRGHRGHDGRDGHTGATGPTGPAGVTGSTGPVAPEVPTAAFVSPTVVTTIYARLTGSDETGDGTLLNPYRTFLHAIRFVPVHIPPGTRWIVDITGIGNETLPPSYALQAYAASFTQFTDTVDPYFRLQAALNIFADPQVATTIPPGDAVITPADIASFTVNPDTRLYTLVLNAPRASFTNANLRGKFLIGTNSLSNAIIASVSANTTLELTISDQNAGFVPAGNPFTVMEPSATLQGTSNPGEGMASFNALNCDSIAFGGIKFLNLAGPGVTAFQIRGTDQPIIQLCDIRRGAFFFGIFQVFVSRCYLHGNAMGVASSLSIANCFVDNVPNSVNIPNDFLFETRDSIWEGCFPLGNMRAAAVGGASPVIGFGGLDCPIYTNFTLVRNALSDGIYYSGGGGAIRFTQINNSMLDAIRAEEAGGTIGLFHVTGSGNGGLGVRAIDGAHVQVDASTTVGNADLRAYQSGNHPIVPVWPAAPFSDTDSADHVTLGGQLTRVWRA